MRMLIPNEEGALILNYEMEMAMLDHYPVKQTTYQLVHDDFNFRLAVKYGHVVDVFICHNSIIFQKLRDYFPDRAADIFFIPHGVAIPAKAAVQSKFGDPIRLLFLGRMTKSKGIFDLPIISGLLDDAGVPHHWTCIGNGPELETLKAKWGAKENVDYYSPASNLEVIEICAEQDVFVLPTKFEGSPVSLLETMSVGLVPVITALPGGITDIVKENIGFALPIDNNESFAAAIASLFHDVELRNQLSKNCRKLVMDNFDLRVTAKRYHDLFRNYETHQKPKVLKKLKVGARLDRSFLPNTLVKYLRSI
jgi:glycosyltransferase involved in cell wall biosynthesis